MGGLRYFSLSRYKDFILLIARVLIVILFILFGYPKLTGFNETVHYMASLGVSVPTFAATIAVLMEVGASILIVLGFFTRPIALAFALYTVGAGIVGHAYWHMFSDIVTMKANMLHFYKNISITGGFLLLSITGPGAWSLDRH
ncbi:DoxX family protein [Serratia sp. OS31]|uniref:DoxX family protein n=1 Tax=Serratia sp. OS31 TaxID=2760844 RepID=UPI00160288D9|nr:DoxX family protein [Serratia sp. OS31]MBB1584997.1 DoxX family protein [Serratia sp. OS31]